MNKKTIAAVINRKMSDWVASLPVELRPIAQDNMIVTGGSIASLLLGEEVNDYDVYFKTKESAKAIAAYYCNEFNARTPTHKNKLGGNATAFVLDGAEVAEWKEGKRNLSSFAPGFANQGGEDWREDGTWSHMITNCEPDRIKVIVRSDGVATAPDVMTAVEEADDIPAKQAEDAIEPTEKYKPVFLSTNAITLSGKIQLVVRFQGDAAEIHKNYDFVHCTNYWSDGELTLKQDALEALMAKELRYVGSKYPLCSVIRTRKFLKRGFHINAGQYLKMCFQISQLDLTDIDVLEEQLVGVDSAYFRQLIDSLRFERDKNPSFNVDTEYVSTVIDKIF